VKRWVMGFIGLVVAALAAAVVALLVWVDPQKFVPQLQARAQDYGVSLELQSIRLQVWPQLGLKASGLRLDPLDTAARGSQPLLQMEQLSMAIPLKPLLQGELQVSQLHWRGGGVALSRKASGVSNWQWASAQSTSTSSTGTASGGGLRLSLPPIQLEDLRLSLQEAEAETLVLQVKRLETAGLNLEHQPFELQLVAQLEKAPGLPRPLALNLSQQVQLAEGKSLTLRDGKGRLGLVDGPQWDMTYSLTQADGGAWQGSLAMAPFNPRPYLALLGYTPAQPEALSSLGMSFTWQWQQGQLQINPGELLLDQQRLNWRLTREASGALDVQVQTAALNLDAYLPAPTKPASGASAAAQPAAPPALLRQLQLNARLEAGQVQISGKSLKDVALLLNGREGIWQLQAARAEIYEGMAQLKGELRLDNTPLQLNLQAALHGLSLGPALSDLGLGEGMQLSGRLSGHGSWQAQANQLPGLLAQLRGEFSFNGEKLKLTPLNLTEQYCKMVNMITLLKKDSQTWEAATAISRFDGVVHIAPEAFRFQQVRAETDRLAVQAQGEIQRATGDYRINLPLTLRATPNTQEALTGCDIGSAFWVERSLPLLRCKGQVSALNLQKDCGPDGAGIGQLIKDYALYKLQKGDGLNLQHIKEKAAEKKEALKEKAEQKAQELKQTLSTGLGEERAQQLENKLKRLLGKKEPAPEAAPPAAPAPEGDNPPQATEPAPAAAPPAATEIPGL
jgi:AsmA protein